MKKRINDSEIENAKKSTKIMHIIISLCTLLLIFLIAYIVYLYEKGEILQTEDGQIIVNDTIKDNKIINKKLTSIDINNTNSIELWDYVKISTNPCLDGSYTDKKSIKTSKLSDTCRYSLASNIYKDNIVYDEENMISYVSEEDVKNAYEKLFEVGSYQKHDSIIYANMNELMYNKDNKYYFTNGRINKIDDALKIHEKILSIYKESTNLYITSVALFYEPMNNYICKDINCEKVVSELVKDKTYSDEYFELYLDSKQDNLSKYTYHFKQDNAGFYKYVGYERKN